MSMSMIPTKPRRLSSPKKSDNRFLMTPLKFLGKRILLGVTGSIAAYKSVGVLRALIQEGADVSVVMTASATRFVTPLTFEVLSKHPVRLDLFGGGGEMPHLTLPTEADAIVVAPSTANFLAKCALGLGDDLLSALMLNAKCPLILAPAMDGDMWSHPAIQTHVETIRGRGVTVLEPEEGPLASGEIGKGRLPHQDVILGALEAILTPRQDWLGQRVLVSAGPTQEVIDPVRFISNRSSGKMGYALARAARERGAQVSLVSGPSSLSFPRGVECESVHTAEEMNKAMTRRLSWSTVVIMAAAVADFRPTRPAGTKLKKTREGTARLELEPTEDILENLSKMRNSQILVGFAAETQDVTARAKQKLHAKGLDLIVGNAVGLPGTGFDSDHNTAVLIDRDGRVNQLPTMPKELLAHHILDAVLGLSGSTSKTKPRFAPR